MIDEGRTRQKNEETRHAEAADESQAEKAPIAQKL
jgi:hypothetical protein